MAAVPDDKRAAPLPSHREGPRNAAGLSARCRQRGAGGAEPRSVTQPLGASLNAACCRTVRAEGLEDNGARSPRAGTEKASQMNEKFGLRHSAAIVELPGFGAAAPLPSCGV